MYTSTTTTTKKEHCPQKFRGRTIDILAVLSASGGLTTCEIAERLFQPPKKIWEYCKRGYRRGIFERKERWGWCVSPLGFLVLSLHATTTTTVHTTSTQHPHNIHTTSTPKSRQLNLAPYFESETLEEADRNVVVVLSEHFERTGIKFRIFQDQYDLAEAMHISEKQVIPTLRHLREEGCIYFRREALGWKIGLMKGFVERMQYV